MSIQKLDLRMVQGLSVLTPEQFGAVGDGAADDTAALTKMFSAASSGSTVHLPDGKTYLTGSLTIPGGVKFSGGGVIKGVTSGSRPTRSDLTGAVDAAGRSGVLRAHYQTEIAFASGNFNGTLAIEDALLVSPTTEQITAGSILTLTRCAADNLAFRVRGRLQAPGVIVTNASTNVAFDVFESGVAYAPEAVVTNCYRAGRTNKGGSIVLESAEMWNQINAAVYVLVGGGVNVRNSVIDGATLGGLITNYGGDIDAEGITIRHVTDGVAIIVESNGSCFAYNCAIEDCDNALGVALGGFIQARGASITGTAFVVANALNDGFIDMENVTVDPLSNPGVAGIRFQATGSGRIHIPAMNTGGLTGLTAANCNPEWNSVGRGNAYIGPMDGSRSKGRFASLQVDAGGLGPLGLIKQVTIADDGVYIIDLGTAVSSGTLEVVHNAAPLASRPCGKVRFRATTSPFCVVTWQENTLATSTVALTGTTGADGTITVSSTANGKLYVENRSGGSLSFTLALQQAQAAYSFP